MSLKSLILIDTLKEIGIYKFIFTTLDFIGEINYKNQLMIYRTVYFYCHSGLPIQNVLVYRPDSPFSALLVFHGFDHESILAERSFAKVLTQLSM